MKLPAFIQRRLRRSSQVYLRPTLEGGWWLGTLVILLLMGWGYSNNLCLAIGMLLSALTVILLLEAHFNLDGLKLAALVVEDQFQGRTTNWRLFWHMKRKRERRKIKLCWDGDEGPSGEFHATADHEGESQGSWLFPHRGRWCQQYVILRSRYPLGLFEAWNYHPLAVEAWVYPPLLPSSLVGEEYMEDVGTSKAVESLSGDEPGDFRRYHLGDPPARIAWKTLARGLPVHSKTFLEERAQLFHYRWPWGNADERARGQLAYKIEAHHQAQASCLITIHGTCFVVGAGTLPRQKVLRALTEAP